MRRSTRFRPIPDALETRISCSDVSAADVMLLVNPVAGSAAAGVYGADLGYVTYLNYLLDQSADPATPPPIPGTTPMTPGIPIP